MAFAQLFACRLDADNFSFDVDREFVGHAENNVFGKQEDGCFTGKHILARDQTMQEWCG